MSKGSKPASSQKANEIKDLLLDVIQQEESNISDSEIFRLSQPYQKAADPNQNLNQHHEDDSDLELNFGNADPHESVISTKEQSLEKSFVKKDFELSESERSVVFPPLGVQKIKKVEPPSEAADKTVRLNSNPPHATAPQSRPPIELASEKPNAYVPPNPNEATVRLSPRPRSRGGETESKVANGGGFLTSSGIKFKNEAQIGISSPAEAVLKQSENLRIAQARITSLEEELERLRQENSHLSSAGEILRRRSDELLSQSEAFENKIQEAAVIFEEEKKVLKAQIHNKDRELDLRKQKVDQLEQRLNSQFDSIRRRERELEHRLEILKVENQDILNGKDKMILDLKRQVDVLTTEANFSKERTQELYGQHKDKQETIRRVVKALRMALTILEGDEDTKAPLKKVD